MFGSSILRSLVHSLFGSFIYDPWSTPCLRLPPIDPRSTPYLNILSPSPWALDLNFSKVSDSSSAPHTASLAPSDPVKSTRSSWSLDAGSSGLAGCLEGVPGAIARSLRSKDCFKIIVLLFSVHCWLTSGSKSASSSSNCLRIVFFCFYSCSCRLASAAALTLMPSS